MALRWAAVRHGSLRSVKNPRLHFPARRQSDYSLAPGVHTLVRDAGGVVCMEGMAVVGQPQARLSMDRRGLWLQVAEGAGSVHVNGRPVRRMALLRPGDAVYLGGEEILLQGTPADPAVLAQMPAAQEDDPRIAMRGLGGLCHGRSFTLASVCTVGAGASATIPIDGPDAADAHATLERRGDHVILRDLGSSGGSLVNGVSVREALLSAGDQVVFGARNRFVLEVPWLSDHGYIQPLPVAVKETSGITTADTATHNPPVSPLRWPWLLLAAALLGLALSALLLFGAH